MRGRPRSSSYVILKVLLQALRKEKSRDAARSRRGKENFEFYELAKMLPLPGAITSQLDKASLIRLTISHLRMRDFAILGDPPWVSTLDGSSPNTSVKALGNQQRRSSSSLTAQVFGAHLGSQILQSLDGFVFVLNYDGRFLYISETVSIYLGLSQVEMAGSSIYDYVHPGDHVELSEHLGIVGPRGGDTPSGDSMPCDDTASSPLQQDDMESDEIPARPFMSPTEPLDRSFFIRMKSTLTKRGLHVKTSGYKVIHVTGRLHTKSETSSGPTCSSTPAPQPVLGLVALAHALPPPTVSEIRVDSQMFVTRLNLDLKIIYCESRVSDYMDLTAAELVGKNCYHFVHAHDGDGLRDCHTHLLNKGQCVTKYYRWMQRAGGYVWLQSVATIAVNTKASGEKSVIWINYVLSNHERRGCLLDIQQVTPERKRSSESSEPSDSDFDSRESSGDEQHVQKVHCNSYTRRSGQSPGTTKQADYLVFDHEDTSCHVDEDFEESSESRGDSSAPRSPNCTVSSWTPEPVKLERLAETGRCRQRRGMRKRPTKRRKQPHEGILEQHATQNSRNDAGCLDCIKTETVDSLAFEPSSNLWDYPPNREIASVESSFLNCDNNMATGSRNMTSTLMGPYSGCMLPNLHVTIPDSVLTPPGPDSATSQSSLFVPSPGLSALQTSVLAPTDPLSPPLSASPRDVKLASLALPASPPSALDGISRPLPLTLASNITPLRAAYTAGTIRYAPADPAAYGRIGESEDNPRFNHTVPTSTCNIEGKAHLGLLYQHMPSLGVPSPFAGPVLGSANLQHLPVFPSNETFLPGFSFPLYGNGGASGPLQNDGVIPLSGD
uniref:neuronal PAS domain-containing protein 3-like n=1 Tax=Myxine glutinosa TaxID=7769 RepID=UPI00358E088C